MRNLRLRSFALNGGLLKNELKYGGQVMVAFNTVSIGTFCMEVQMSTAKRT